MKLSLPLLSALSITLGTHIFIVLGNLSPLDVPGFKKLMKGTPFTEHGHWPMFRVPSPLGFCVETSVNPLFFSVAGSGLFTYPLLQSNDPQSVPRHDFESLDDLKSVIVTAPEIEYIAKSRAHVVVFKSHDTAFSVCVSAERDNARSQYNLHSGRLVFPKSTSTSSIKHVCMLSSFNGIVIVSDGTVYGVNALPFVPSSFHIIKRIVFPQPFSAQYVVPASNCTVLLVDVKGNTHTVAMSGSAYGTVIASNRIHPGENWDDSSEVDQVVGVTSLYSVNHPTHLTTVVVYKSGRLCTREEYTDDNGVHEWQAVQLNVLNIASAMTSPNNSEHLIVCEAKCETDQQQSLTYMIKCSSIELLAPTKHNFEVGTPPIPVVSEDQHHAIGLPEITIVFCSEDIIVWKCGVRSYVYAVESRQLNCIEDVTATLCFEHAIPLTDSLLHVVTEDGVHRTYVYPFCEPKVLPCRDTIAFVAPC
jgi:hypothetical protein